jgi:hypothetical protein
MRYRAVVLSICGVLAAGAAVAPPAAAADAGCADQLVADLLSAPVPDPTTIIVRDGLNVHVDTTGTSAFTTHVRDAALRFADCATPNPLQILPCVQGVVDMIVDDITRPIADDEIYLRYFHSDSDGFSVNGEYAVSDALAIAGCVV